MRPQKTELELFLVGLNFKSANTRDSAAHLLVMAVLVRVNASRGPRRPRDELPSTKMLAEVFLIKTVNASTGDCRGSSSQTASHYDKILGEALHFGHFKTSQFTIEVQHSLISLVNLTERTQRA